MAAALAVPACNTDCGTCATNDGVPGGICQGQSFVSFYAGAKLSCRALVVGGFVRGVILG